MTTMLGGADRASLYSMVTCGSAMAMLMISRAFDRSSPTTMGMRGTPGSEAVMADSNRPALSGAYVFAVDELCRRAFIPALAAIAK